MQYTSTPHTPIQDPKLYFPHSALLDIKRPPKYLSAVTSVKQSPNSSFVDHNTTPTDTSFYIPQGIKNFVPISINSRNISPPRPLPPKKKTALDPIRFFYPVKLKKKDSIQKLNPIKVISNDSARQPMISDVRSDIRSIAPIKQRIESICDNQTVCANMRRRLQGVEQINYTFDFRKQTPRKMGIEEYLEKINENPLTKPKRKGNRNVSFDQYTQLGSSDSQRSALMLDSSRYDAVLPPVRNNSPIKPPVQLPTIRLKNPPQVLHKKRDYSVGERSDLGTVREEVEIKNRPQQNSVERRFFTFDNVDDQSSIGESHATKAKRFLREGKELEVEIHKDIDEYREKLLQKLKRENISRNLSIPSHRWGD